MDLPFDYVTWDSLLDLIFRCPLDFEVLIYEPEVGHFLAHVEENFEVNVELDSLGMQILLNLRPLFTQMVNLLKLEISGSKKCQGRVLLRLVLEGWDDGKLDRVDCAVDLSVGLSYAKFKILRFDVDSCQRILRIGTVLNFQFGTELPQNDHGLQLVLESERLVKLIDLLFEVRAWLLLVH